MIHSDVTIRTALTAALTTLGIEGVEPQLEHPGDLAHGDWSTNVALAAAKLAQKSPRALADELVAALGTVPGVAKLEVAGPGFINFYLDRTFFSTATADIAAIGKDWGKGASFKGRKMVIEYSCTNPFKEMHMGHFMSTVIGEAVSRLATNAGATVIRDS